VACNWIKQSPAKLPSLPRPYLLPEIFTPNPHTHAPRSNEAYILASHVVEHVSRMPLAAYFQEHMFDPLGLASTFMDVSNGQVGTLWQAAARAYLGEGYSAARHFKSAERERGTHSSRQELG
jgi:CubicO group peptidase (beta-lactamase class C family)